MKSLIAIAVLALAGAAHAQSQPVRQHYSLDGAQILAETRVPYADLDLSSSAGLRTLMARIEAAADRVCGITPAETPEPTQTACRKDAVAEAVARMRTPALAELPVGGRSQRADAW
jgi:UrcA family protein